MMHSDATWKLRWYVPLGLLAVVVSPTVVRAIGGHAFAVVVLAFVVASHVVSVVRATSASRGVRADVTPGLMLLGSVCALVIVLAPLPGALERVFFVVFVSATVAALVIKARAWSALGRRSKAGH